MVVEWKLTTFLRQEPWLHVPPRTREAARLRVAREATGDPTRASWRIQPRLLTQKRGQFLQNILASAHIKAESYYTYMYVWVHYTPPFL